MRIRCTFMKPARSERDTDTVNARSSVPPGATLAECVIGRQGPSAQDGHRARARKGCEGMRQLPCTELREQQSSMHVAIALPHPICGLLPALGRSTM